MAGVFCQGCGNELASQYRFCPSCGGRDIGPNRPAATPSNPTPPPQAVASQQWQQIPSPAPAAHGNYGGFWRRVGATLIDQTLLFIVRMIIIGVLGEELIVFLAIIAVEWIYYAFQESSTSQATLGKKAFNLRVYNMQGQRVSFGQATGRYFGKLLSGLILGIGFIMVAFTARKQGLHDMMAGTVVLHRSE